MPSLNETLLNALEEQLPIILDEYIYLPFYLAIPYLNKRTNSILTVFNESSALYLNLDKERQSVHIVAHEDFEVDVGTGGNFLTYGGRTNEHILTAKCYVGKIKGKISPLVAQKHYSFRRQNKIANIITQIVQLHQKVNKEVPNHYVFPYLLYNRDNIIKCAPRQEQTSNFSNHALRYKTAKYFYLKLDSKKETLRESFNEHNVFLKMNAGELVTDLYSIDSLRQLKFTLVTNGQSK